MNEFSEAHGKAEFIQITRRNFYSMKKIMISVLILLFVNSGYHSFASNGHAAFPVTHQKTIEQVSPVKNSFQQQVRELEKLTGRKLTLKERIALRIQRFAGPYDKDLQRKANNQAQTGFILSILGFVLLWPLLIPGLIISNSALQKEKVEPGILTMQNRGLAKAGRILGLIGLVLIFFVIVLVLSTGLYGL